MRTAPRLLAPGVIRRSLDEFKRVSNSGTPYAVLSAEFVLIRVVEQ